MARQADRCDCAGCVEFRAVHARLCPELPREERQAKRKADRDGQRRYEDHLAAADAVLRGAA